MMPSDTHLLLFLTAAIALNLTPGPDMLYVMGRSLNDGRRAGVISALGVSAGILVHTALVVVGLGQLLARVPAALMTLKYIGAAYLIYLGVRMLCRADDESAPARLQRSCLSTVFWQGALTNVLNPKVVLFFLAFLPQFVDPARGSVPLQLAVLALLFNISGTLVNLAVALLASSIGQWSRHWIGAGPWVRRVTGILLAGLGARLAVADLN